MANIPLLYPGCTALEILDTINALIAAITGGTGQSISYNDLTDKPTLNGVEINGDQTTENLKIKIAETADFETYNETVASKPYVDAVEAAAVAAAQNAANAALANKLDKDLSNLDLITYMGDNASILVVTPDNRLCRVSTADLASYTGIVNATAASSQEASMKVQRKTIALNGEQDGQNIVFTCTTGYTMGTSSLFLNGNRLYPGKDYIEDNSHQITFRTYIPETEDVILFEAIPLESARQ
jgi:hypothetical protein